MASPFNFDKFETRQLMGDVVSILLERRGPGDNGQPLTAATEGAPLHALMGKLRVGEEAPPENFDFELGQYMTVAQALQLIGRARTNPAQNMLSAAGRVMYHRTLDRNNPD